MTPGQRLALLRGSGGIYNRGFIKVLNRKATGFSHPGKELERPRGRLAKYMLRMCKSYNLAPVV